MQGTGDVRGEKNKNTIKCFPQGPERGLRPEMGAYYAQIPEAEEEWKERAGAGKLTSDLYVCTMHHPAPSVHMIHTPTLITVVTVKCSPDV